MGFRISGSLPRRPGVAVAAAALAVALGVAGCATPLRNVANPETTATVTHTADVTTTSPTPTPTTTSAKPVASAPTRVPVDGGDVDYSVTLQTYVRGCNGKFRGTSSIPEPELFDPIAGRFTSMPLPPVAAGEHVSYAGCSFTGTPDALKVAYLVTSVKPPSGLEPEIQKTVLSVFATTGSQPLTSAEVTIEDIDRISGTAGGVAVIADRGSVRTTMLSNTDLTQLWTDPKEPAYVGADLLIFPRNRGLEARDATGAAVWSDPGLRVSESIADGPNALVFMEGKQGTVFFDPAVRAVLDPAAFPPIDSRIYAIISADRLFIHGSRFGLQVWNRSTNQVEFSRTPEELDKLSLAFSDFFGNHLYLRTSPSGADDTYSVIALPDENPIATGWNTRPLQRMNGWTLVATTENSTCERSASAGRSCDAVLIRDVDGGYPGSWY